MSGAGQLQERVAFDRMVKGAPDTFGHPAVSWVEALTAFVEFKFQSGDEAVQAARNAGRMAFKVKLRRSAAAMGITTEHRMRDVTRGLPGGVSGDPLPGARWNVVSVDSLTDRQWIWIAVEGPQG